MTGSRTSFPLAVTSLGTWGGRASAPSPHLEVNMPCSLTDYGDPQFVALPGHNVKGAVFLTQVHLFLAQVDLPRVA